MLERSDLDAMDWGHHSQSRRRVAAYMRALDLVDGIGSRVRVYSVGRDKKKHQLLYFVMLIVHYCFSQMMTMNNIRDILKEAQVLL